MIPCIHATAAVIKLLGTVPRDITVALSGGVDSMALIDFLRRNHNVKAAFFHHGTGASQEALEFLQGYCRRTSLELEVGHITGSKPNKQSWEEWWRIQRYNFLDRFPVVATAHHLDDVAETWVWSSFHGCPKLLPYRRANVIRPLLLNRKDELVGWATGKGVEWVQDRSNDDLKYARNYIRKEVMPRALEVNPGLHSVLRKKLVERGVD